MSKRKTVMTVLGAVLGVSVVLCLSSACSRQEKPKAVEKKPRTMEIAPTPAPATGMVRIVRQPDTNSPHYRAPQYSASTPESRKALREKQKEFSEKVIEQELTHRKTKLISIDMEMGRLLETLIGSDLVVSNAYQNRISALGAYENIYAQLVPEYAGLMQKISAAKIALESMKADRRNGRNVQENEMRNLSEELSQLLKAKSLMLRVEYVARSEIKEAYHSVTNTDLIYRFSLEQNKEFRALEQKKFEIQAEYDDLVARQQVLTKEK